MARLMNARRADALLLMCWLLLLFSFMIILTSACGSLASAFLLTQEHYAPWRSLPYVWQCGYRLKSISSMPENDVEGVDNTRNVSQEGEQDIQPEMAFEPHLQKHTERRQQDRKDNLEDVGEGHG
jgi:hypothetical protein